jgi:hypothetical protein
MQAFFDGTSCGCRSIKRDWAGEAASLGHVRNAPLATVGAKKAVGRLGPIGDLSMRSNFMRVNSAPLLLLSEGAIAKYPWECTA